MPCRNAAQGPVDDHSHQRQPRRVATVEQPVREVAPPRDLVAGNDTSAIGAWKAVRSAWVPLDVADAAPTLASIASFGKSPPRGLRAAAVATLFWLRLPSRRDLATTTAPMASSKHP